MKRVFYGEIMRYKSAEDLENDHQKFLIDLTKIRAHLKNVIDLSRRKEKANKLLSKYEKKKK